MKIKNIWYRIRQFGFSIFMYLAPLRKAELIQGEGSIYQIPELIKKEGKKKVLVVTTPGFIRRGSLKGIFNKFEKEEIQYAIYSEVCPDPDTKCVEMAVRMYKEENCEAIVAIGGGSVIDCSKALGARIAKPDKSLEQMQGLLKVMKKLPVIFAVPTTAGTGSEATAGAVITNSHSHYKFTIMDLCLIPKYAVLDPQLTYALPHKVTAATGMDALTHAIEAYTNCFCSPKVKKAAEEAVQLIYHNLGEACQEGVHQKARENMLLASYYAGVAINQNFVGYVHAVAHGIGGIYGMTHGEANAVILPYMLESYGKKIEKKLSRLADLTGIEGGDTEQKAKAFIASIREWNHRFGISDKIEKLQTKDYAELVKRAKKEGNPMYPVPVIWEDKDFICFLDRLKNNYCK